MRAKAIIEQHPEYRKAILYDTGKEKRMGTSWGAALLVWSVIATMVAALAAAIVGCVAFVRTQTVTGDKAKALCLVGINLCEPIINVWLIPVLWNGSSGTGFRFAFMTTITMAVLLLPALGLVLQGEMARRVSRDALLLGVLRWGLLILMSSNTLNEPGQSHLNLLG